MSFEKLDELLETAEKIVQTTDTPETSNVIDVFENKGIKIDPSEFKLDEIKQDFVLARDVLYESLNMGKSILSKINSTFDTFSDDSMDPELINAVSSLIKTITSNLKTITESYKKMVEIQNMLSVKSQNSQSSQNPQNIKIENINITSSTHDTIDVINGILGEK